MASVAGVAVVNMVVFTSISSLLKLRIDVALYAAQGFELLEKLLRTIYCISGIILNCQLSSGSKMWHQPLTFPLHVSLAFFKSFCE
jgi:hypothetical protein